MSTGGNVHVQKVQIQTEVLFLPAELLYDYDSNLGLYSAGWGDAKTSSGFALSRPEFCIIDVLERGGVELMITEIRRSYIVEIGVKEGNVPKVESCRYAYGNRGLKVIASTIRYLTLSSL